MSRSRAWRKKSLPSSTAAALGGASPVGEPVTGGAGVVVAKAAPPVGTLLTLSPLMLPSGLPTGGGAAGDVYGGAPALMLDS